MHRYLAIGYALTVAALVAVISLARGAVPRFDGITAFLASQVVCLVLFPAAALIFIGAQRSPGKLRKFIGFSIFAIDSFLVVGACVAIVLIVVSNARFHAA